LAAQDRQGGAVDPLGGYDVDVVERRDLLGRECLGRTEHHVAGVVDHDVQAAVVGDDARNRGVDRKLVLDVQFDAADVDVLAAGEVGQGGDGGCVAVDGVTHAGVHDVPGAGQGPGGEVTEAAGGAGDDDDLRVGHQMMPPLTRMFWPLIQ
jgi:hypothetical protein